MAASKTARKPKLMAENSASRDSPAYSAIPASPVLADVTTVLSAPLSGLVAGLGAGLVAGLWPASVGVSVFALRLSWQTVDFS